jgi:hypothetical protein
LLSCVVAARSSLASFSRERGGANRDAGDKVRKEENDMTMTSRSHVSYKSRDFKIGVLAGVGDKSRAPKSWREPPYFIK